MAASIQTITIINKSTVLSDDRLTPVIPALQTQLSRDFLPFWGVSATLEQATVPSPNAWPMYLLDTADVENALGYHEDPSGLPDGKVFIKTTMDAGLAWPITLSHEILEALVDPTCTRVANAWPFRYALEVGDPVESDRFGYSIDGIMVSDFVTPFWFGPARPNRRYDFRGFCLRPRLVLPGGYQLRWDPLRGWRQLVAQQSSIQVRKIRSTTDLASRPGTSGRTVRRLRAHH